MSTRSPDPLDQSKADLSVLAVNLEFGVPSSARKSDLCFARQLAMYLSHTCLGMNYARIARAFKKHHSTVRHALAVTEDLRIDPEFDNKIRRIETFLQAAPGRA